MAGTLRFIARSMLKEGGIPSRRLRNYIGSGCKTNLSLNITAENKKKGTIETNPRKTKKS